MRVSITRSRAHVGVSLTVLSIASLLAGPIPVAVGQSTSAATRPSELIPQPKRSHLTGNLPAELKVKLRTGRLLVSPQINGKDAGWFIFDTGAGMSCVDASVVKKLDLPDAGAVSARGEGGVESTRFRKVESLMLGPIVIEDSTVVELDLKPIALAMGERIDGVVGYECFVPGVFEVDLDAGKITIHDPATYALATGQAWAPLVFHGQRPRIVGQIEAHPPGEFILDIGANTGITITTPTVKSFNLLDGRQTTASKMGGVGGIHDARTGTLSSITLCGQRLNDVTATFSQAEQGGLASDEVHGSIGVGLLKKFILVLNYRDKSVALLPRR